MITIQGLNEQQQMICDMLWACESIDEVEALIQAVPAAYRTEFKTMKQMIELAAIDSAFDEQD